MDTISYPYAQPPQHIPLACVGGLAPQPLPPNDDGGPPAPLPAAVTPDRPPAAWPSASPRCVQGDGKAPLQKRRQARQRCHPSRPDPPGSAREGEATEAGGGTDWPPPPPSASSDIGGDGGFLRARRRRPRRRHPHQQHSRLGRGGGRRRSQRRRRPSPRQEAPGWRPEPPPRSPNVTAAVVAAAASAASAATATTTAVAATAAARRWALLQSQRHCEVAACPTSTATPRRPPRPTRRAHRRAADATRGPCGRRPLPGRQ